MPLNFGSEDIQLSFFLFYFVTGRFLKAEPKCRQNLRVWKTENYLVGKEKKNTTKYVL